MTKRKAKSLTLQVWRYLRDHPELDAKSKIPEKLYKQIEDCISRCPLCDLFIRPAEHCKECPLSVAGQNCNTCGSAYNEWTNSKPSTYGVRAKAAGMIVDIVKRWDVK